MLPNYLKPKISIRLIRMGSLTDGGYFVPFKILKKIKKIISCGLGIDWSFEENFKKKNKGVEITFYDHSINTFFWFKNFFYYLYFYLRYRQNFKVIFAYFYYYKFFRNKKINHKKIKISKSDNLNQNIISLKNLLKLEKNHILLKVDIEGDEYKVLDQIIKYQQKLDCIIIEFHKINKNLNKIKSFIKKLNKMEICNICPNNSSGLDENKNPKTIEVIFINKIFLSKSDYKKKIQLKCLPNNPYKKNIQIKFRN